MAKVAEQGSLGFHLLRLLSVLSVFFPWLWRTEISQSCKSSSEAMRRASDTTVLAVAYQLSAPAVVATGKGSRAGPAGQQPGSIGYHTTVAARAMQYMGLCKWVKYFCCWWLFRVMTKLMVVSFKIVFPLWPWNVSGEGCWWMLWT